MENEVRILDSAYLDELKEWKRKLDDFGESDQAYAVGEVISDLEEMPTVDAVEVVHGRWIDVALRFTQVKEKCSVCGGVVYAHGFNYCPNCGAKMDGDGNA